VPQAAAHIVYTKYNQHNIFLYEDYFHILYIFNYSDFLI